MTVKKGDIVFVSQAHHSTPVPAVVLSVVPATSSGLPQANVHIISSSDPYASILVAHREYSDDSGYLEADESEPTESHPVADPTPEGVGGTGAPESTPEESEDESEESEGSEEVPEGESDGESLPATGRKRGGRSRR